MMLPSTSLLSNNWRDIRCWRPKWLISSPTSYFNTFRHQHRCCYVLHKFWLQLLFEYIPYQFGSIVCTHYLYFDPKALADIDTMRILIDYYSCSRQEFVAAFDESFVLCYFHRNALFCIAC